MEKITSLKDTVGIKNNRNKTTIPTQQTEQTCWKDLLEFCSEDLGVLWAVVVAIRNAIFVIVTFTVITNPISIRIGLTAIGDKRTVVVGVENAIAVGISVARIAIAISVTVLLVTVGDVWAVVQVILDAITVKCNSED